MPIYIVRTTGMEPRSSVEIVTTVGAFMDLALCMVLARGLDLSAHRYAEDVIVTEHQVDEMGKGKPIYYRNVSGDVCDKTVKRQIANAA